MLRALQRLSGQINNPLAHGFRENLMPADVAKESDRTPSIFALEKARRFN
jgi:hypothetical protein